MSALAIILAASGDEFIYIVLVLVFIGGGWVVQRIKSAIEGMNQQTGVPPRPRTRPHPTSLPRPMIPPLAGDEYEQRRPSVERPPVPRTRPPVRPPVPTSRAETPGRPGMPARPFGKQRPHPGRTLEERKAVIRGEEMPAPRREIPPAKVPPVTAAVEPDSRARLSSGFEQIRPSEQVSIRTTQLLDSTATAGHAAMEAESLRHLSPAQLRQAFVLKEILEPPLALREM